MMEFEFTEEMLDACLDNKDISNWYDALSTILPKYDIDTPERVAAFIAQCAHESNQFKTLKENLNYRWESLRRVFPKYFPTDDIAKKYAAKSNKQEAIANRVYANRMGNGDEASGDGWRYCGRGLIQLTGKNNYQAFADSIEMDISEVPEYLGTYAGAVQSACWFWDKNSLNDYADSGDIHTMTKRINGGFNGIEEREYYYKKILEILSA